MDLPERLKSFLLPLSRSFSIFLPRLAEGRSAEAEPEVTVSEERHLLVVLLEDEEDSDFFSAFDFFFG